MATSSVPQFSPGLHFGSVMVTPPWIPFGEQ